MSRQTRRWRLVRLALYLLLPLVFLGFVALSAEVGQSLCLWRGLLGISCPSCGASRALGELLQLNFTAAVQHNPVFALGVYPVGFFLIAQDLFVMARDAICRKNSCSLIEFVLGRRNG